MLDSEFGKVEASAGPKTSILATTNNKKRTKDEGSSAAKKIKSEATVDEQVSGHFEAGTLSNVCINYTFFGILAC